MWLVSNANAQGVEALFRAADGTAYQVLSAENLGAAERLRITTVAGSIVGAGSCNGTGMSPGELTSAIGGVLPNNVPPQILFPYGQIRRTVQLTPNSMNISFTNSFGGRVTLGSGAGALNICGNAFD
ncbi:MAG: hypothetical protein AB7N53_02185, partial [Candidatus Binatia bacterium]